jgi:hypothetical protein
VGHVIQVALNLSQVLVVFQLNPAMEFQVIQRAAHAAVGQARQWLEFHCGTFRLYDRYW